MDDVSEQIRALSEPLPLPCGRSVPNRFVKVEQPVRVLVEC